MAKVVLFVVYHDDVCLPQVGSLVHRIPFARPVKITGKTPYFEGELFDKMHRGELDAEWRTADYVGMVTYNYDSKATLRDLVHHVKDGIEAGADVITFLPIDTWVIEMKGSRRASLQESSEGFHKGFRVVWHELLASMGFDRAQYEDPIYDPFFCNFWMARRECMERTLAFLGECRDRVATNPRVRMVMHMDSGYTGRMSTTELVAMTGKPYYTFHAFVFERLPCFFFRHMGYVMHHAPPKRLEVFSKEHIKLL